ncbi:hypothetical protein U0070_019890 [Myodes glareolus]|uniref:Uncharacterized protein n=1 Tax=Myodes glareolus TaxID=447135 RepID=A0AAW0JK05_MYOGA
MCPWRRMTSPVGSISGLSRRRTSCHISTEQGPFLLPRARRKLFPGR